MNKFRLMTPGPSPVPEETLLELAKPVFFHRSEEFRTLMGEVEEDLRYVFRTRNRVMTLTSSGTGAMEAAVSNSLPPGSRAICLISGRWGERWRNLCKAFGVESINVTVPYGKAVQPEQLARALTDHPDAMAVFATLSETSTGVANDLAGFGKLVGPTDKLLIADTISGLEKLREALRFDFPAAKIAGHEISASAKQAPRHECGLKHEPN